MEQNSDIENREIEKIMAEDLRRTQERSEEVEPGTAPGGSKSLWHSIIFTGVGVLILIIVFIVFFKSHEKAVTVNLNTIRLRLNMLEGRLTHLEKQGPELQESMSKLEEPESSLILRLDELSQQVDQLEKQMASAAMEA
ncbi:MAG: hypothetical protein JSW15_04640, partial [Deltaproteobacteria bacterium]